MRWFSDVFFVLIARIMSGSGNFLQGRVQIQLQTPDNRFLLLLLFYFSTYFTEGFYLLLFLGGGGGGVPVFLWRPIALVILFISQRDGGRVHLLVEWGGGRTSILMETYSTCDFISQRDEGRVHLYVEWGPHSK